MAKQNQLPEGFQLLDEEQLLQEFHVEELEKRYEFAWVDTYKVTVSYSVGGSTISYSVGGSF